MRGHGGRGRRASASSRRQRTAQKYVLAVAGGDVGLGVFHQAAARRAVIEAQRVARLVDGDLGQPLAGVSRAPGLHPAAKLRDDARGPVDAPQPQDAPVADRPLRRRDVDPREPQDARAADGQTTVQEVEQLVGPVAAARRINAAAGNDAWGSSRTSSPISCSSASFTARRRPRRERAPAVGGRGRRPGPPRRPAARRPPWPGRRPPS